MSEEQPTVELVNKVLGRRAARDWIAIKHGDAVTLMDGTVREVTSNPQDGVWIFVKNPDGTASGEDEMLPLTDVRSVDLRSSTGGAS